MSASDQDLLSDYAQRKDAEAFATLVERYQSLVYGTTLRRLGNSADADEVTQEVFLSLATNAHKISGDKLGGWLYRSALNAAYSRLRSDRARTARERARATPDHQIDASVEWRQIEEVLDACFAELPTDSRELIIQRFFANRSQQDLADALGVDQATISRRLKKAVDQLRHLMAGKGVSLTVAALVAGLAEHATATTVPTALSASLNKIGVAGVGKKAAAVSPLPVLSVYLWPTIGIAIAGLLASTAVVLVALAGDNRGPTTSVVAAAHPLSMAVSVELTRLDYSQRLSSSAVAINNQGLVVFCNDRPSEMAGLFATANGQFQRLARLPEHVRRAIVVGPRNLVAISYDRAIGLFDGSRLRTLSEAGVVDVPPSINARGWVAMIESDPVSRIRLFDGEAVRTLLEAGDRFARFDEVCINDAGDVAFRATTHDGVDGLFLSRQGTIATVAEVGDEFTGFRPWFDFNNDGQLAFVAQCTEGSEALYVGDDAGLEQVARSGGHVASLLQVSLNNAGSIAFTAQRPQDQADLPIAGLYLWDGTQIVELLVRGQQIAGRSLEGVLLWRDCLNDDGQIAFVADFGPAQRSAIMRLETNDLTIVD